MFQELQTTAASPKSLVFYPIWKVSIAFGETGLRWLPSRRVTLTTPALPLPINPIPRLILLLLNHLPPRLLPLPLIILIILPLPLITLPLPLIIPPLHLLLHLPPRLLPIPPTIIATLLLSITNATLRFVKYSVPAVPYSTT